MKATLITFNKKVVDVPDYRDKVLNIIDTNEDKFERNFSAETTVPLSEYKDDRTIFERIVLEHRENIHKDSKIIQDHYFVNYEDMEKAMPLIKGMITAKTRELNWKHIEDQEGIRELNLKIKRLEDNLEKIDMYWFNRLWKYILNLFKNGSK